MPDAVEMPMFPLGSVLFPAMPLPLRVFESRYVDLLQDVLQRDEPSFGVVLIERGQEVGGGEHRFGVGAVARLGEVTVGEGSIGVLAHGGPRIEVVEWLDDDPYPQALVRVVDELVWDEACRARLEQTEGLVRRTLARAGEIGEQRWASTVELSDDPIERIWQLAAISPLTELDQIQLLLATSTRALLDAIFVATQDAGELLDARSDPA